VPADLLAFGLVAALAAEPAAPAHDPDDPPVALIEFLGLWTTEDGQWIDPEALDALPDTPSEAPDAGAATPPPEAPKGHPAGEAGAGNEGARNGSAKTGGEKGDE